MVADVGGTNTRLALFDPAAGELRALVAYDNRDHQRFEDIIACWLQTLSEPPPTTCCIAVAAPPSDDRVPMININWSFSCRDMAQRFGFTQLGWINDFPGIAYALPHLGSAAQS